MSEPGPFDSLHTHQAPPAKPLTTTVPTTDLPFAHSIGHGKVRDLYELGGDLLLVATDRISAFDVVMAEPIPHKGAVLTEVSAFWFELLRDVVPNHLLETDVDAMPDIPAEYRDLLRGRTMRCRRADPMPVEWVVRGYLTGSGWQDYQRDGKVSGVDLPAGMQHASAIQPAILTPSTKAETGHDEPITLEQAAALVGQDLAERTKAAALQLYDRGRQFAAKRGIVIADTKFEFGLIDGELTLIDECLTPDSSRFWPADEVEPGGKPKSFDKQVLRDHLAATHWDKSPPPPTLSQAVIDATSQTYLAIRNRLLES